MTDSMAVQRVKNVRNGQSDYFCTHVKARGWTGNACCPVASNNIAVKKLDTLVWNQLLAGLKEPAALEALLTEASTTVSTMEAKTGRLADSAETRLRRLETDMAALVEQTLDPNLNAVARSYLTERMNALGDDITQAKAHLAEEQERLANQQAVQERISEVKYTVERMAGFLDHLDFAAKRNLLFAFGVQVYVWRGRDPENKTDPRRAGQRYILRTDFTGLNLGARLETDWDGHGLEVRLTMPAVPLRRTPKQTMPDGTGVAVPLKRSTNVDTENNASNYSIANAFDMQELLGLTVAGGETIPEPIAQTLAARAATPDDSSDEKE